MSKLSEPLRPAVPLLLAVGLSFWAGNTAGDLVNPCLAEVTWVRPGLSLVLLLIFLALLAVSFRSKRQGLVLVCALFVLGVAFQLFWHVSLDAQRASLDQTVPLSGCCLVLEDVSDTMTGTRSLVLSVINDVPTKVMLYLPEDVSTHFGALLDVRGTLDTSADRNARFLDAKGATFQCQTFDVQELAAQSPFSWLASWRDQLAVSIEATWQGDEESLALFEAIALGRRGDLANSSLYQEVKVVGLAHLVAVSGAHLALVASFVSMIMRALRLPLRVGLLTELLMLLGYLVLVGLPISCMRATVMVALGILGCLGRRRRDSKAALGFVICLFVASDPSCATQLSFSLSVLATLGILLFMPLCTFWLARVPHVPRPVVEAVAMTIAATLLTCALTASTFGTLPLMSPVANLAATPFLSIMVCLALLVCILSWCPLAFSFVITLSGIVCTLFEKLVGILATIPFACIPATCDVGIATMVTFLACLLLWLTWPMPGRKGVLMLLLVGTLVFAPFINPRWLTKGDDLVMLDVGQGDAFLVESQGRTLLVDTGCKDALLLQGLASEGVPHLDAVLITHADADHCASLSALVGTVDVGQVFVAAGFATCEEESAQEVVRDARGLTGASPTELPKGSAFHVGAFAFEVISPERLEDGSGNQDSLCVLMTHEGSGQRALFVGDAEAETLESLDDEGLLEDVDILKVGHHGSRVSLSPRLMEVLRPEVALIGVGADNRYGHPNDECLALLEEGQSTIYRSDMDGKVVCNFTTQGIRVTKLG